MILKIVNKEAMILRIIFLQQEQNITTKDSRPESICT